MNNKTKKMTLAGMAVLMGAGVVVGTGAMKEPVVQSAEAKAVKLGKYKVKSGFASSVKLSVKGKPLGGKLIKKGEIINLIGYKSGVYTVSYGGKQYLMQEGYMKNLTKL